MSWCPHVNLASFAHKGRIDLNHWFSSQPMTQHTTRSLAQFQHNRQVQQTQQVLPIQAFLSAKQQHRQPNQSSDPGQSSDPETTPNSWETRHEPVITCQDSKSQSGKCSRAEASLNQVDPARRTWKLPAPVWSIAAFRELLCLP